MRVNCAAIQGAALQAITAIQSSKPVDVALKTLTGAAWCAGAYLKPIYGAMFLTALVLGVLGTRIKSCFARSKQQTASTIEFLARPEVSLRAVQVQPTKPTQMDVCLESAYQKLGGVELAHLSDCKTQKIDLADGDCCKGVDEQGRSFYAFSFQFRDDSTLQTHYGVEVVYKNANRNWECISDKPKVLGKKKTAMAFLKDIVQNNSAEALIFAFSSGKRLQSERTSPVGLPVAQPMGGPVTAVYNQGWSAEVYGAV